MTRVLFRGFGAVVTTKKDTKLCSIAAVPDGKNAPDTSDPKLWIDLDFGTSPNNLPADPSKWTLDDRGIAKDGTPLGTVVNPADLKGIGVTSIGPLAKLFASGQLLGGVYLQDDVFGKALSDGKIERPPGTPWIPATWHSYQVTSVRYSLDHTDAADPLADKRRGLRYHGFHGKVTSSSGSIAIVEIANPANAALPLGTFGFDFADPTHVDLPIEDPRAAGKPMIDPVNGVTEGGIWVNLLYGANLSMVGPKLPFGLGA